MGARVFGLGDQPAQALPSEVQEVLTAHLQVRDLWDETAVVDRVRREAAHVGFDQVECLWEPAMVLAARIREALGVPGLTVDQTIPFRDKEKMKQVLDAAGIRTPWHSRARTAGEVRSAAAQVGFPLIVKPISGAGATDTYRIDSADALERIIPRLVDVPEVSVEEYIDGEEFTFDTVSAGGRVLYENIAFYRPRPIEEKKHQWISPSSICLRDIEAPELQDGRKMGYAVLQALGFRTGFSHMEWYRRADGEVVFGEIGARPPGARMVDAMNFASDVDLFKGWAEAVCHGSFSQPIERRYNSAIVCKRAQGEGKIHQIDGLDRLLHDFGSSVAAVHINSLGSPAGNWRASAVADGFMIVRHPDLDTTLTMAARIGSELQIYAAY